MFSSWARMAINSQGVVWYMTHAHLGLQMEAIMFAKSTTQESSRRRQGSLPLPNTSESEILFSVTLTSGALCVNISCISAFPSKLSFLSFFLFSSSDFHMLFHSSSMLLCVCVLCLLLFMCIISRGCLSFLLQFYFLSFCFLFHIPIELKHEIRIFSSY